MTPKTPKSIKHGHEILCTELKVITYTSGEIGEKAKALEKVMYPHFEKEEKYALPPLGLLLALSEGSWEIDSDEAIKMSDMLKDKLAELKGEHDNISIAMENLRAVSMQENNLIVKQFLKDLLLHIEMEDQVLYPATILIGNYLKHLKLHPLA